MLKELQEKIAKEIERLQNKLSEIIKKVLNENNVKTQVSEDLSVIAVQIIKDEQNDNSISQNEYIFSSSVAPDGKTNEVFSGLSNVLFLNNGKIIGSYSKQTVIQKNIINVVFQLIEEFRASENTKKEDEAAPSEQDTMLTIISIVLNVLFLVAIVIFIVKPEIFNNTIDTQFKSRRDALHKYYQQEESKLQRELTDKTKAVAEEVFALRRKLEKDINMEIEESRRQRHLEINEDLENRISMLREREKHMEDELMKRFEEFKLQYDEAAALIQDRLQSLKSYEAAAVEARVRMYEEANKEKFYMIKVEDSDVLEIDELLEILPKLRNPIPLRKAIFDIYYRQPVKDLIYRVVGADRRTTGIYKITLIETGECYIGQSVDIGNRWMQHIRRGFGIDDPSDNKLYPAMMKYALHAFKFEVVELCSEDWLNEKEKYWADYFKAKEFGFSIKN